MTKINDPKNLNGKLFGYEIKYNQVEGLETPDPLDTGLKVKPKFNGNIAEVDWRTNTVQNDFLRRYGYVYDKLNRLSAGFYQRDDHPSANEYYEKMVYDLNGNITNLKRTASLDGNTTAGWIDDLAYGYFNNNNSNRLISVTDSSTNYGGYPEVSGIPIPYDANGNMTSYEDKGILQIDYNFLNLPDYIKFDKTYNPRFPGGDFNVNTKYLYRADSTKLRKLYTFGSGRTNIETSTITEYLDGFQYEATDTGGRYFMIPKFVPTAEGYYNFENNKYIYNYTDHLGNVRLSYFNNGSSTEVLEESNYYPFGLEHDGYNMVTVTGNPSYNYGFQEQEKQKETGWSSFKWRNYDPTIGRFFNIDPLSEKYSYQSHYNFSENRVVDGRELEGLEVILLNKSKDNNQIIKVANNGQYKDDPFTKTVHVFAHGNPKEFYNATYKGETTINDVQDLNNVLSQGSDLWKNSKNHEGFTVVLHSCRTGRCNTDDKGNVIDPIALQLSKSEIMKDVEIIAPDERDVFYEGKELGPRKATKTDKNGDLLPGVSHEEMRITNQKGNWNTFKNGEKKEEHPGTWFPSGAGGFWNHLPF